MATIKEEALAYEPSKIKNVCELDTIPTDVQVYEGDGSGEDDDGKPTTFKYKYIELNEEKYRVPWTVLDQLRTQMEANPQMKNFKVNRKGTTKTDTRYTVIPLA